MFLFGVCVFFQNFFGYKIIGSHEFCKVQEFQNWFFILISQVFFFMQFYPTCYQMKKLISDFTMTFYSQFYLKESAEAAFEKW